MKILLIHQNFPGQFRHLTRALMQDKTQAFVTVGREGCPGMASLSTFSYKIPERDVSQTHPYVLPLQSGVIAGQAVFRLASRLRQDGFVPDVVLAHPGWGETLYIREVFPEAALVHFCEYYYQPTGQDAGMTGRASSPKMHCSCWCWSNATWASPRRPGNATCFRSVTAPRSPWRMKA
jgi:hypothetical protein